MAAIPSSFGSGGSGLTPNGGDLSLATILREIAVDLDSLRGPAPVATITAPALAVFTNPPSVPEMAAVRALVNELRALAVELRAAQVTRSAALLTTAA